MILFLIYNIGMGNSPYSIKINYQDVSYAIKNKENYLLINTLSANEQECLLPNTVDIKKEEILLNDLMAKYNKDVNIILYGKNQNDDSIYAKEKQLTSLGFSNVYIYTGGLFEWLMLQDIYGENMFPTTKKELDILKYKPTKILNVALIEYK